MQFFFASSDILSGNLSEFKISLKDDTADGFFSDYEDFDPEIEEHRYIEIKTPIDEPFDKMKLTMSLISHGIYKEIITEGSGDTVPSTSRLKLDFNAFFEGNSTPFQSSWVERERYWNMGEDMLPGFYYAVLTMKQGEVAKFIIPYQLLYGALGCESQAIPEKADGLYIIRVYSFEDVGDSSAITESFIDQHEPFDNVLQRVIEVRKSAKARFKEGKFESALLDFKKCVSALNFCRDARDEERDVILQQLYVNMSVCYNKMDRPQAVLDLWLPCMDLLKGNCKAMFQMGRAHFLLTNYDAASQYLTKAQRMEPNNKEVAQELKMVNEAALKYQRDMKEISRKAMQSKEIHKQSMKSIDPESYKLLEEYVEAFVKDESRDKQLLPVSLTELEVKLVKELAEMKGVEMMLDQVNNEQWRYLVKVQDVTPELE